MAHILHVVVYNIDVEDAGMTASYIIGTAIAWLALFMTWHIGVLWGRTK